MSRRPDVTFQLCLRQLWFGLMAEYISHFGNVMEGPGKRDGRGDRGQSVIRNWRGAENVELRTRRSFYSRRRATISSKIDAGWMKSDRADGQKDLWQVAARLIPKPIS
jgi:hypothetical protein